VAQTHLRLQPGALLGLVKPSLWTVGIIFALASLAMWARVLTGAPPAPETLQAVEVHSVFGGFLESNRAARLGINLEELPEVVSFAWPQPMPYELMASIRFARQWEAYFPIHNALKLGRQRVEALGTADRWRLTLFEKSVVAISSAESKYLLPYAEFVKARATQLSRWKLYATSLAAIAIACFVALKRLRFLQPDPHTLHKE
jgi:hypothetical protein